MDTKDTITKTAFQQFAMDIGIVQSRDTGWRIVAVQGHSLAGLDLNRTYGTAQEACEALYAFVVSLPGVRAA